MTETDAADVPGGWVRRVADMGLRLGRRLVRRSGLCRARAAALMLAGALASSGVMAQGFAGPAADAYRAGRVAATEGSSWVYDAEDREWTEVVRNRPVAPGDRWSTAADGRLDLRFGSTVLRLGSRSELEVRRLDDEHLHVHLVAGSLALRVRDPAAVGELQVSTAEGRFRPLQPGHYRIDREDDMSLAGTWHGDLLFDETPSVAIGAGHRLVFWREPGRMAVQSRASRLPEDALTAWALSADAQEPRTVATAPVSPEMTGVEDLHRHGRWDQHPELGAIWIPLHVRVGWAPFTDGRWLWVAPWGWTWVDAQPWGFAPFHYGHWVQWHGRWVWAPGPRHPRPVFIPAPVRWHGPGKPHDGQGWDRRRPPLPGSHWAPRAPGDRTGPWPDRPAPGREGPRHGWDRGDRQDDARRDRDRDGGRRDHDRRDGDRRDHDRREHDRRDGDHRPGGSRDDRPGWQRPGQPAPEAPRMLPPSDRRVAPMPVPPPVSTATSPPPRPPRAGPLPTPAPVAAPAPAMRGPDPREGDTRRQAPRVRRESAEQEHTR